MARSASMEKRVILAAAGLLVNVVVAWTAHNHDRHDLNVHGAFRHVLPDTLASVGVTGAGI